MRVKFGIVIAGFFFASCSSDLPGVPKFEFCYFKLGEVEYCRSFYELSKEQCDIFEGKISNEENCKDFREGK